MQMPDWITHEPAMVGALTTGTLNVVMNLLIIYGHIPIELQTSLATLFPLVVGVVVGLVTRSNSVPTAKLTQAEVDRAKAKT